MNSAHDYTMHATYTEIPGISLEILNQEEFPPDVLNQMPRLE